MESAEIESPTKAARGWPIDRAIRDMGYTIAQRPTGRLPMWAKRGILFSQNDVLLREGKTR